MKIEANSQCVPKKMQRMLSSNLTASARCVAKRTCLLDLDVKDLVRAKFLRRPSRRNRSPYGMHAVVSGDLVVFDCLQASESKQPSCIQGLKE